VAIFADRFLNKCMGESEPFFFGGVANLSGILVRLGHKERYQSTCTKRKGHMMTQTEDAICKPRREGSGGTNLPVP
jgi:hypothetical protein